MVSLTRQPATQSPAELGTVHNVRPHASSVAPEFEVYRFGNGCFLTSTERVTVPVVLADHLFSVDKQPFEDSVAGHFLCDSFA